MICKYLLPFYILSFCWWFPLLCRSVLVRSSTICLFLLLFLLPEETYPKRHFQDRCQKAYCLYFLFLNSFIEYNWSKINGTYLNYTVCKVLTYIYIHETNTTIKIKNTSIIPKSSLVPFCGGEAFWIYVSKINLFLIEG